MNKSGTSTANRSFSLMFALVLCVLLTKKNEVKNNKLHTFMQIRSYVK